MIKSTRDGRTIDPDPTEPFKGLCKFVEWWTEFQQVHCQGVEATWTLNFKVFLKLDFKRGHWTWRHVVDLTDVDQEDLLLKLDIGLLKLRNAPIAKPNESES